ncbi:MAG: DUF4174 domain-containing protein [Gammaproteobacteria bacterium]|nr:DUF4174 domain-containing protein [Gammaproteobacteria bacterium]
MLNLFSQDTVARGDLLEDYVWQHRVLLIFTPDPRHSEFVAQQEILAGAAAGLIERDLVVLRMTPGNDVKIGPKTSPGISSDRLYRDFSIDPETFRVLLIGKDGTLKLTRSAALATEVLFNLIDSMPMRQLEMQNKGAP